MEIMRNNEFWKEIPKVTFKTCFKQRTQDWEACAALQ